MRDVPRYEFRGYWSKSSTRASADSAESSHASSLPHAAASCAAAKRSRKRASKSASLANQAFGPAVIQNSTRALASSRSTDMARSLPADLDGVRGRSARHVDGDGVGGVRGSE